MTLTAVTWRDNDCNGKTIVIHGVCVVSFRFVAFVAADPGIPVRAVFPLADDPWHINMAVETFPGFDRQAIIHGQSDS